MLQTLVIAELRLALRSQRVRLIAAVTLAMAIVAGLTGRSSFEARRDAHRALTRFAEDGFDAQPADHPHTIAHRGYVVSRPPPPLGFLDGGLDRAVGRWLRLDAHRTRSMDGARTSEVARAPGGGRFDLGLFLVLIAPAFLLVLGYDRVGGGPKDGTFAMLRAAGLRAGPLVASKLIGLAARATLGIGGPVIVVALALTLFTAPEQLPRAAAWLLVHALGLAAWGALGLAVSAAAPTPRAAFGLGLAAWAILALAVPPAASAAARAWSSPPPPATLAARLDTWAESAHAQSEALRRQALEDIQRRHPEWDGAGEPPEVVDAVMLRLTDRDLADRMRGLMDEVAAEQRREARRAAALSFASPSGLTLLAGSAIAGSDLTHARAAADHFEAYRQTLMAWFNEWWAKNGAGGFDAYETAKLEDLSAAPRPRAPEATAALALEGSKLPCLLLLGLIGLGIAAFTVGARRRLEGGR